MKIGLLSDIHGNLRALQAVLRVFDTVGVDRIICLGDTLGYYHQSIEVLDTLIGLDTKCILGNHEAYLLGYLECSKHKFNKYFLQNVSENISLKHLHWLSALPVSLEVHVNDKKLAFYHGSPFNPLEDYIYPDSHASKFDRLSKLDFDYIFLGHTHYPMLKKAGRVTIINPGSCGQPRDGDIKACGAIMDTEKDQNVFVREAYDSSSTIREALLAGVSLDAIQKLERGTRI
jgi:putative phosphoesterase